MLIAFDIDGTIVNDEKELSSYTFETLNLLHHLGHTLVPCTGRNYKDIPDILYNSNFIEYVIAANGTVVYDMNNQEVIQSINFTPEEFIKVMDITEDYHPCMDYISEGKSYIAKSVLDTLEDHNVPLPSIRLIRSNRTGVANIREDIINNKRPINRANVLFKDLNDRLRILNDRDKFTFSLSTSMPYSVEIMPKGISKLTGLMFLQEKLGLTNDEIFFFGDNMNDYEAISSDYNTVAMLNGLDEVKKAAKNITDYDNNHSGVAQYLRKIFKL